MGLLPKKKDKGEGGKSVSNPSASVSNPASAPKPSSAAPKPPSSQTKAAAQAAEEAKRIMEQEEAKKRAVAEQEAAKKKAEADAAKKKADEEKAKAEAERKKVEAAAEAKKKAEADAKAKEEAAKKKAEAEAKAAAEAEMKRLDAAAQKRHQEKEVEWKKELAALAAAKKLDASLTERLTGEILALRHKLLEGTDGAEKLEEDIKENSSFAEASRKTKGDEIGALDEQLVAVRAVLQIFSGFNDTCGVLATEVLGAHEAVQQQKSDAQSIASRITQELKECEERLAKVEERKVGLEGQMTKLLAEIEPAEKKAEAELQALASAAIAARLQAQLGERHVAMVKAELAALNEAEAEVKRNEAKATRVAATRTQVKELKAQLASDEESMRQLSAKGKKLELAEAEATRRAKKMSGMFDAQLASARQLAKIQKEFLDEEAAKAEVMPAGKELFDKTAAFVKAQHEASLKEVAALEQEKALHEKAVAEAAKKRSSELRQLTAERQAVGVANGERQRFFEEKSKQLEAEEKEAASAAAPLEGRDACLKAIQAELATVQAASQKMEAAATQAEAARKKQAAALEALRSKDKGRVSSLRVQIDSERSVAHESSKYVLMLQGRLKDDSLLTLSETDEDTKVRQRGLRLVEANGGALKERLDEMTQRLETAEATRAAAEQALKDVESSATSEEKTLREQLSATRDAVAQLQSYEAGLVKLLSEGGGDDVVGIDMQSMRRPSEPGAPPGAPPPPAEGEGEGGGVGVPGILNNLVSSAELATKVIDDNIKASRMSRIERRSVSIDSPKGAPIAKPP